MKKGPFLWAIALAALFVSCEDAQLLEQKSSDKAITSFVFTNPVAIGTINNTTHSISVTVPSGTNTESLIPSFVHTGTASSPESGVAQDFSAPVIYTITAEDESTQSYVVVITVAGGGPQNASSKAITAFAFTNPAATGLINEAAHTVSVTVPNGTDLTSLVPTIVHTGASVSPQSGAAQNFSSPVTYTVSAEDSSTQPYVVTVTAEPAQALSSKSITAFGFPALGANGTIDESSGTITVIVPYGTDLSGLTPEITCTGANYAPAFDAPADFSGNVSVTVTAEDSSTKPYTVIVKARPATPVIAPSGSVMEIYGDVSISCESGSAQIRYTQNGSTPNSSSSPYTGPFRIANAGSTQLSVTINAVAFENGVSSLNASKTYSIRPDLPPEADAGRDIVVTSSDGLHLDGTGSSDPNGYQLTYSWFLVSAPEGSTSTLGAATAAAPSFSPDKVGTYTFSLSVSDGLSTDTDTINVSYVTSRAEIDFVVLDAEYSQSQDTLVMVSASPSNAIKVYRFSDNSVASCALPYVPVAVSVSPDGTKAAVGYNLGNQYHTEDNYVSIVDLSSSVPAIARTITLDTSLDESNDISDLVLTADHVFIEPRTDQWVQFRSINLTTNVQVLTCMPYDNGYIKLRPGTDFIFYSDVGLSPPHTTAYSISGNTLSKYADTDHGESGLGGKLWMAETGLFFITESGRAFDAQVTLNSEIQPLNWLNGSGYMKVVFADHSAEAGMVAVIAAAGYDMKGEPTVRLYDDTTLAPSAIRLPTFAGPDDDVDASGEFVFFNADGSKLIVISASSAPIGLGYKRAITVF